MRRWMLLLALFALTVGASVVPNLPDAPAAGEAKVFGAWSSITNQSSAAASIRSGEATPPVRFHASGVVEMPVDFSKAAPSSRASWDIDLSFDLRFLPGIQFDFLCDDVSQFSSFSCYFRSGNGWYHSSFSPPEENGAWHRVTVMKSRCIAEGNPDGWSNITAVRISGWRSGTGRTRCALANMSTVGATPDVAIVYADALAAKGGADVKGYMNFASTVNASLSSVGVESVIVADRDLTAEFLKGMRAVVLPYNPQMPSDKIDLLRTFVSEGRRILACYTQPREIYDMLGIRINGAKRPGDDGGPSIAGFLRVGNGLEGQPDFVPQASWMTQIPMRGDGVEVLAEWADGKRNPIGIPALVKTKAGLYMSHVWLGGTEGPRAALIRAIACALAPSLKKKTESYAATAARNEAATRDWLATQPSKRGESRAFWCHSARGLGGGRDWDESIKFLKENGFNAIIPNLCWGGVAFYDSQVLPVAADVEKKGDAFAQCREACRKYGVKMHVWKVCWNMGPYAPKTFEDRMVSAGRTQVDAKGNAMRRWLCPSHPDNQEMEINAMVELAKKGPDGIHFDYIRYPDSEKCFCAGCRARFEAKIGRVVKNWPGDVRGSKAALRNEWQDFRKGNISKVVETVARRVRKEAPGVKISAALFGNPLTAPESVAQDWPQWCRAGWLDFACHMDYVESSAMFRNQVKQQMEVAGKKVKIRPGIGLSCWENDGQDGVRFAKQVQIVRDLGLDGFTVFNFDRRAELVLPLMRMGVTSED